ncbi:hypothetical protein GCM10008110_16980 [Marinobacter persicus]|nr:hypothetical protein GCM10008110_16980 [Marinobacter persicus]
MGNGECEPGGDRRVHGIATVFQDVQGDFRGQCVAGGDHALGALDGVEAFAFQNGLGMSISGSQEEACQQHDRQAPPLLWQDFLNESVHRWHSSFLALR